MINLCLTLLELTGNAPDRAFLEESHTKYMSRSLRVSSQYIKFVKMALRRNGYARQRDLAEDLRLTRTTVSNFLNGKPIDYLNFLEICGKLGLDYQKVAGLTETITEVLVEEQDSSIDIDHLVQSCREKVKPYIKERCGTMRVLDMTLPIGLDDIYTNVNILETITGRRRLKIEDLQAELLQNSDTEELDRFGLCETQKRVPGLNAVQEHSKLMVLGKPGAGKTTFLKYLAIQCIEGQFQSDRFPIFITLKDFAEAPKQPSILEYIAQQLSKCKVTDANLKAEQLLEQGKVLILLDGLDEVREEDTKRVLKQVQEFSYQYHTNQFVITCRIAAKEYTFQGFTEVEVADFDFDQIATFAQNWFRLKDPVKGERFIQKLKENEPILELATNPLLLTLLCLVFGEAGDFPANRSELYTEGVDVLLKKWDVTRNIERDRLYKDLSLQRKEDLLSQIALTTFEQKDYFFKKKTVEAYIVDFISNLCNASTEQKELELDSEAVLKSIEAQHGLLVARATGIYSFSDLTFHEYFAAREITRKSAWERLVEHITEKRWREVFLLTVGMMREANDLILLMKQKIDDLLAKDEKLQQFLAWVEKQSKSVKVLYKPAAIRAFHFDLALERARYLDLNLALDRDLNLALNRDLNPELKRSLQQLLDQLLDPKDIEAYKQWWQENGQAWTEQLRAVMIKHRNIGHDWQFTEPQKELLKQYYDANKLLIDCLNSDCYVSREVRQEIEDTLLLPVKR